MTPPTTCAIVPAAGDSRRFGSMKLLADVAGVALLSHTLRSLLEADVGRIFLVVAPGHRFSGVANMDDPRVTVVSNPDPSRGMFSSIQAGLAEMSKASPEAEWAVVLPADMPFVRPATIQQVLGEAQWHGRVAIAVHGGTNGHPIVMPRSCCQQMLEAPVSSNLKAVFAAANLERMPVMVDDPGVVRDIDVPADLTPSDPRESISRSTSSSVGE